MKKIILKKDKRTMIEKEADRILEKMSKIDDQTSDEYKKLTEQLSDLVDIDVKKHPVSEVKKLDKNTILVVLGGLMEIVLIMSYENLHVITTKAFQRIIKPKF